MTLFTKHMHVFKLLKIVLISLVHEGKLLLQFSSFLFMNYLNKVFITIKFYSSYTLQYVCFLSNKG